MHDTAMEIGSAFFDVYCSNWKIVLELGSMDVNGSLRASCPAGVQYLGMDVEHGKSVDLIVKVGEQLPLRSDIADAIISSSQLEHDDFFWETFLEFARVVRPGGFIYINAPSNGVYHRYPNDNWRFYPDCGHVLARWARKHGHDIVLVESFVADKKNDVWNDFVAIFRVGPTDVALPDKRLSDIFPSRNVWKFGAIAPDRVTRDVEDISLIKSLRKQVTALEEKQVADEVSAQHSLSDTVLQSNEVDQT